MEDTFYSRFKFRVYRNEEDPQYSSMVENALTVYNDMRHAFGLSAFSKTGWGWGTKEMLEINPSYKILMQYCGFEDKNGKEVFEDDLFYYQHNASEVLLCRVVFDNQHNGWVAKPIDNTVPTCVPINFLFIKPEHIEVIGNYWQNKNLPIVKYI